MTSKFKTHFHIQTFCWPPFPAWESVADTPPESERGKVFFFFFFFFFGGVFFFLFVGGFGVFFLWCWFFFFVFFFFCFFFLFFFLFLFFSPLTSKPHRSVTTYEKFFFPPLFCNLAIFLFSLFPPRFLQLELSIFFSTFSSSVWNRFSWRGKKGGTSSKRAWSFVARPTLFDCKTLSGLLWQVPLPFLVFKGGPSLCSIQRQFPLSAIWIYSHFFLLILEFCFSFFYRYDDKERCSFLLLDSLCLEKSSCLGHFHFLHLHCLIFRFLLFGSPLIFASLGYQSLVSSPQRTSPPSHLFPLFTTISLFKFPERNLQNLAFLEFCFGRLTFPPIFCFHSPMALSHWRNSPFRSVTLQIPRFPKKSSLGPPLLIPAIPIRFPARNPHLPCFPWPTLRPWPVLHNYPERPVA